MRKGNRWIPIEERLWRKVDKNGPLWNGTPCWLWTGACDTKGYGHLGTGGAGGKTIKACRVAYELTVGIIPEGLGILHHCDNPACVNPEHLFTGTQTVNLQDMTDKGRRRYRAHPGSDNGMAKLSESQVRDIRERVSAGELRSALAKEFEMDWTSIANIASRRSWKSLT